MLQGELLHGQGFVLGQRTKLRSVRLSLDPAVQIPQVDDRRDARGSDKDQIHLVEVLLFYPGQHALIPMRDAEPLPEFQLLVTLRSRQTKDPCHLNADFTSTVLVQDGTTLQYRRHLVHNKLLATAVVGDLIHLGP